MTDKPAILSGNLLRFCRETSGGVMAYVGILLPILLAVAGLSVDVGLWYANKRVVQSAADASALGGALEVKRMGNLTTLTPAATEYAT